MKGDPRCLSHKVSKQPCYFLSWLKQVKIKPGENWAKSGFKFNGKSALFVLKTLRERYRDSLKCKTNRGHLTVLVTFARTDESTLKKDGLGLLEIEILFFISITNSRVLSGKNQKHDRAPLKSANKRMRYYDNGSIYEIIHWIINNSEIPGELSIKNSKNNMLSAHVEISPLLWLHDKSREDIQVKWFRILLAFV